MTLEISDVVKLQTKFPAGGLRIRFSVERDKTEIPNNLELAVYNLSPSSRAGVAQQKDFTVKLDVGYQNPATIFTGVGRGESFFDPRTGDWMTRISAGDGQDKYSNSKVNKSFVKGTPVHKVLQELVSATGLDKGNVGDLTDVSLSSGATELERAYVARGPAMFELQQFADSLGLDWSFQDGSFIGAPAGEPFNPDGPLLTPETGLLWSGLDEVGNVEGQALMIPDLIPGAGFRVESSKVTGNFICVASQHSGDTHADNDYTVHFHGIPLGATSDGLLGEAEEASTSAIGLLL